MKLMFNVSDRGSEYEVISINNNEIPYTGIKDASLEVFSWAVFEYVARALNEGNKVFIPKIYDKNIDISDIVVQDTTSLEKEKNKHIIKIRDITAVRFDKFSMFSFVEFVILSNFFAEKGFFITDDNREEKYLEIINYASTLITEDPDDPESEPDTTESDKVINNLERYLMLLDLTAEMSSRYYTARDFVERIEMAETVEEIETIYTEFRNVFH